MGAWAAARACAPVWGASCCGVPRRALPGQLRAAGPDSWRRDRECQRWSPEAMELGGCRPWVVLLGFPHPPSIGPEPEQRAEPGSDDECRRVPESALQAHQILDNPDAPVID